MWGLKGKTGDFTHTREVTISKKDDRLIIADYPGSTSIDNHANAFAHLGTMNNLVFFLLNDNGNVNAQPDLKGKKDHGFNW